MNEQKRVSPLMVILGLSAVFFVLFVAVSWMLMGRTSNGDSKAVGAILKQSDGVGVLEINGVILDSKKTVQRIEAFDESKNVKAIIVRINSPGGAVGPSQEIYEALKRVKKPVIASMGSVAASGGYYVALAANKIYANSGTLTGSIGVIMQFANLEKLYDWAKIKRFAVTTGKFKDAGADYKSMNEEEKLYFQSLVDDVLTQFRQAVVTGRKLPLEEVVKLSDGRVFSGTQALAAKLIDATGTFQDAVEEAAKQGKITGKPKLIYPAKPHPKFFELLMDANRDEDSESESQSKASGFVQVLRELMGAGVASDVATMPVPGVYWLWKGL